MGKFLAEELRASVLSHGRHSCVTRCLTILWVLIGNEIRSAGPAFPIGQDIRSRVGGTPFSPYGMNVGIIL
jgi:hypothetical protein